MVSKRKSKHNYPNRTTTARQAVRSSLQDQLVEIDKWWLNSNPDKNRNTQGMRHVCCFLLHLLYQPPLALSIRISRLVLWVFLPCFIGKLSGGILVFVFVHFLLLGIGINFIQFKLAGREARQGGFVYVFLDELWTGHLVFLFLRHADALSLKIDLEKRLTVMKRKWTSWFISFHMLSSFY